MTFYADIYTMEIENGNAGGNNGMNPDDVLKIVASIIAGFGGFGAVIVLVIKFSANMIANRLAEKYSLKMNKELEKFRSIILDVELYHQLNKREVIIIDI